MKQVYRESKTLLVIAKNVFGKDLVNNAFISTWYDENNPYHNAEKLPEIFENKEKIISNNIQYGELEFEGDPIILEFNNGKRIMFDSGESGWLGGIDVEKMELR